MMKLSERMDAPVGVVVSFTIEPNSEIEKVEFPREWYDARVAEVAQLEEEKNDLLDKLVAGEELYISRGMEIVQLEKKNKSLMKLAGMYIKSYEDLAFVDALKEGE